ncbi:NAAT family transporter [Ectothiorhodospiraceae bacterium 2226]|nr:NAAT family transporter [Ectothiorhodospiraceae bacterium 2226]
MLELLISTFVVLFVVLDPIGTAAIFVALTPYGDDAWRRRMALRAVALSTGILLAFFFVGTLLLDVVGITMPAFRIAGGILLGLIAIDMMFARQSGLRSTTVRERLEAGHKEDISVFPLAFPLIAGPGAMTTVLLMQGTQREPLLMVAMLGVLLLVLGMTLVSLLAARHIARVLGETGTNVVSRLLGLILVAMAVQFVIDGVKLSFGLD